jgi:phosphopantothenoylcysteine synthetase/decarboxylase
MKVIVTCGPSYEPIDEVRRITNFSTGELGIMLSTALAHAGYETICLRGVAATFAATPTAVTVRPFTTNVDLSERLAEWGALGNVGAVFHTAALCDYRVRRINDNCGGEVRGAKIASRNGALTIQLEPAKKVIAELRANFSEGLLVGWKYELEGQTSDAMNKARRQVIENGTDACIVNGRAYGQGFGFVQDARFLGHFGSKERLCSYLVSWLQRRGKRKVARATALSSAA